MRRFMTTAASLMMALALIVAPDAFAQTRKSSGTTRGNGSSTTSSQTTRSGSSSSSSKGSSISSSSSTRVSGSSSSARSGSSTSRGSSSTATVSSGQDVRKSTGTVRSGSSTGTVSSGSSSSQDVRKSSGTARGSSSTGTVSSGSSSTGSTVRSSSSSGTVRSGSSSGTVSVGTTSGTRTSGATVRSGSNVSRNGLSNTPVEDDRTSGGQVVDNFRDRGGNYRYNDDFRMDDNRNMFRVPPRDRDFIHYDHLHSFWGDYPHYYGYRVNALPPGYRRFSHWGVEYYFYNGVYYRPYGSVWVVCRPPYYTTLDAVIDRSIMRAVTFSYYCNTYRTYNAVFDYYNTIAQQNLIIAQNNARIAAQNAAYAMNNSRALSAYELANKLGLVQSYAYANSDYYYQDGVFYIISANGMFQTIVPPAGALVTSLPDDYEVIVLNGIEYYMVDNTVYRTTLFNGEPYLEVLGQMYGSMYNQYSYYR